MATTGFVLLGVFIFVMAYDLWRVLRDGGYQNTISQWFSKIQKSWTIFTFLCGVVAGHLFWPLHQGSIDQDTEQEKIPSTVHEMTISKDGRVRFFQNGKELWQSSWNPGMDSKYKLNCK